MDMTDGTVRDWLGHSAHSLITYARFQGLLYRALSRLAEGGFAVPPDEALDLVHDFYVETRGELAHNYDPSRAKFETYVFASFVRFARPRIVRLTRLRAMLVEPSEMDEFVSGIQTVGPPEIDRSDVEAARDALRALPTEDRVLLTRYLDDSKPSERDLAAAFAMTRYQVRTRLVDALGAVSVHIGAARTFAEPDRSIAEALWAGKRSTRETAELLRLPITEIQAARRRMFLRLVQAVRGTREMPNDHLPSGHGQSPFTLPSALVACAMRSGALEQDLAAVRQHRDEVQAYLRSIEPVRARALFETADTASLAAFYAALAPEEDGSFPEDAGAADQGWFLKARDDDERAVGEAFAQVLLPDLPKNLTEFLVFFACPWVLAPDVYAAMLDRPSVAAGGDYAAALAHFGLTPVSIAEAARAIYSVVDQHSVDQNIGHCEDIILNWRNGDEHQASRTTIGRSALAQELVLSFDLPSFISSRLLDWLMEVASHKPRIFDGFEATNDGKLLRLRRTETLEPDLFKRWRSGRLGVEGSPIITSRTFSMV